MIFQEIILHDFTVPLRKRLENRKLCGPYHWTPSEPGKGRGFYMASTGLACAKHGSGFDLRLEWANDILRGNRLSHVMGYYCDEDSDGETLQPIVARLPHGRGFLAGWTMGAGMCASLDATIWDDIEDAAREAHRMAERDAERERDYQAAERERIDAEEREERERINAEEREQEAYDHD